MSVTITQEGDAVRIKTDRAGERAVSSLLSREEAEATLTSLAGMLGYTVTPTGTSGEAAPPVDETQTAEDTPPADASVEDTGTQTGDTA